MSRIRHPRATLRNTLQRIARGARSRAFSARTHDRFWWHKLPQTDYVPPIYGSLSRAEWRIILDWYDDTGRAGGGHGEINVPAMSLLQGLLMGNGVRTVVELGHFYGYSTLLTGFMLRSMRNGGRMVSIDLDPKATGFTQRWIDRAGLGEQVLLKTGDSADPACVELAVQRLGGMPELILLDSSHQCEHTLRELDLWVPRMRPGTLMLLHDTSTFARSFDSSGAGGVQQALEAWLPRHPEVAFFNLNGHVQPGAGSAELVYKDGCGLGLLQRLPSRD